MQLRALGSVAQHTLASCSPRCEGLRLGSAPVPHGDVFQSCKRHHRVSRQIARASSDPQLPEQPSSRREPDVWADAGLRLQNLLSGVGDGEEELLNVSLENVPPLAKLGFAFAAASIIVLGASAICWVCGTDPLGGASLSPHSLKAAEVGLLTAAPLVAAKLWSWTDDAHERFPTLEQMQSDQIERLKPLLTSMTLPQAGFAMMLDTLPTLILGLPAALGALEAGFGAVARNVVRDSAGSLSDSLPFALALMTAAAGAAVAGGPLPDETRTEEEEVVLTAISNSDRYYRVIVPGNYEAAADAFRNVAAAWLLMRESSSRLSGYMRAAQILFLGMLWRLTGDLTAPAVAALSGAAVDTWHMHNRVNGRADQNRAR